MAAAVATYKPTKPEIYEAIGAALADPAMVTGTATDAAIIAEAVARENPNWAPINGKKFKKYQKRVVAAKEAGIDPKDASNLVGDDASVSTIGSMASRAKNFIVRKASSPTKAEAGTPTKTVSPGAGGFEGDDVSDIASTTNKTLGSFKKKLGSIKKSMAKKSSAAVPGSIGGPLFSPSPLKEDAIPEGDGVEYSAVPPPILSPGTADTTPDHSDRDLDLSTSAYVDDKDGFTEKKDECCAQGCIIL